MWFPTEDSINGLRCDAAKMRQFNDHCLVGGKLKLNTGGALEAEQLTGSR